MTVVDLTALINQLLPEPHAGLLAGILFGTKASLSRDLYHDLVTTGTLHIVALSGTNISILTKLSYDSLLGLVSRRIASLLTVLLIIGFIWFVGPSSSVLRAGIMAVTTLCGVILGRQTVVLYTWALAVGSMLIVNPVWLGDISFQLSALATLGIILFGGERKSAGSISAGPGSVVPPIGARNPRLSVAQAGPKEDGCAANGIPSTSPPAPLQQLLLVFIALWRFIEDDLRTTLAAQVFTIPIILWHFHRVSLVSPLTNVLIGWTMAPLTGIGMAAVAAGLVWRPLGQLAAWATWVLLQYVIVAITWTSKLPLASMGW